MRNAEKGKGLGRGKVWEGGGLGGGSLGGGKFGRRKAWKRKRTISGN